MSIDIRWLTNGQKSVIRVRNAGVDPVSVEYFNKPEEVNYSIRHYVPKEPMAVGPDGARMFEVRDILYPNFPKCKHPDYMNTTCIAESCIHAPDEEYTKCPYFDKTYKGE